MQLHVDSGISISQMKKVSWKSWELHLSCQKLSFPTFSFTVLAKVTIPCTLYLTKAWCNLLVQTVNVNINQLKVIHLYSNGQFQWVLLSKGQYIFLCTFSFLGCVDKIGIAFEAPTIATGFGAYLAQVSRVYNCKLLWKCIPGSPVNLWIIHAEELTPIWKYVTVLLFTVTVLQFVLFTM